MRLFDGLIKLAVFTVKRAYQLIQIRIERSFYQSRFYRFISEDK